MRWDLSATLQASILLVDDQEANLLALEDVLAPLGQRLVAVRSADDALRQLLREDFAVVLMDVRMPGMSGFEAARLIRERQLIPIIFLTAYAGTSEEMRRGYDSGGIDYVTKPFEPSIVRNKVALFVELWSAKEELRRSLEAVAERDRCLVERQKDAEAREQFIAVLGHDLRTPLSAITMAADALADSTMQIPRQAIAACVKKSAARMDRLICDVLDLARGRLGGGIPISPRASDLGQVCQQAIDEVRVAYPGRQLIFERNGPALCVCDADRIAQMLSNLLANAIHHGEDPVQVRLRQRDGQGFQLEIANRGAPIPSEAIPRLFTPWSSKKPSSSGGLGLGLYIASEIVHAHQGEIDVRSSEAEGTVVTVTLPLTP